MAFSRFHSQTFPSLYIHHFWRHWTSSTTVSLIQSQLSQPNTTRRHLIPCSILCRRLVMPPSECWWIAVLGCKVLVCEMNLRYLRWPWPLNPKTVPLLGYPKVITYTKFEHFGIIRFWVMLQTNKQTNKQTDGLKHSTHIDYVCNVGNEIRPRHSQTIRQYTDQILAVIF